MLAIDGVDLQGSDNPYRLLQHKTDPVTLTLNATPSEEGARKVTYEPIRNEESLRYLEWVNHNRDKVAEMTGGRVGYLHLPNMGASGIAEFIKWFYPQIRKEGLVVDVRSNGGGNVSQWIIERLDNELLGTRFGLGLVRVLIESGDAERRWGTVGVSHNVVEASWQALVDSLAYKILKDRRSRGRKASPGSRK